MTICERAYDSLFAHGRYAHLEEVLHLIPRERAEIVLHDNCLPAYAVHRMQGYAQRIGEHLPPAGPQGRQCAEENECRHDAADSRCPCRSLHSHGRASPVAEDEGVVAAYVEDVHGDGGEHRIKRASRGAQCSADGQ